MTVVRITEELCLVCDLDGEVKNSGEDFDMHRPEATVQMEEGIWACQAL